MASGLILVYILPFAWMATTSLKTNAEMFEVSVRFSSLMPEHCQWQNYAAVFEMIPFGRHLINSLVTASLSAVLETALAAMAAFGLNLLQWRWKNKIRTLLFLAWLIPFSVVLIPRFFFVAWLPELLGGSSFWSAFREVTIGSTPHMVGRILGLDSFFALIVPGSISITAVFLLITAMEKVPSEICEAAFLASGSNFRVFKDIVVPMITPSLATVGFMAFLSSWQSFTWPLLVTSCLDMQTAAVGLKFFQDLHSTQWPLLMAGSMMLTLPSLGLLLIAQVFVVDRYRMTELTHHRI